MAGVKITDLTALDSAHSADQLVVVDASNNSTHKITKAALLAGVADGTGLDSAAVLALGLQNIADSGDGVVVSNSLKVAGLTIDGTADSSTTALTIDSANDITASGVITAASFLGDGSQLTGIVGGVAVDAYNSFSIGNDAGSKVGTDESIALGTYAAKGDSSGNIVAIGYAAGYENREEDLIAIGNYAGGYQSGDDVVAVGIDAAKGNSGDQVVAIGEDCAQYNTGGQVVAIGDDAAEENTGDYVVALGKDAAEENSGNYVFASGYQAAENNSGNHVVAIGYEAAYNNSGDDVVALGKGSAEENTAYNVIAVGQFAAKGNAGPGAIAIGENALSEFGTGYSSGDYNIAIGYRTLMGNRGSHNLVISTDTGYAAYKNTKNNYIEISSTDSDGRMWFSKDSDWNFGTTVRASSFEGDIDGGSF